MTSTELLMALVLPEEFRDAASHRSDTADALARVVHPYMPTFGDREVADQLPDDGRLLVDSLEAVIASNLGRFDPAALIEEAREHPDLAFSTTAVLVAALALCDRDDYDAALRHLALLKTRLLADQGSVSRVCLALVTQQIAFRLAESGRSPVAESKNANRAAVTAGQTLSRRVGSDPIRDDRGLSRLERVVLSLVRTSSRDLIESATIRSSGPKVPRSAQVATDAVDGRMRRGPVGALSRFVDDAFADLNASREDGWRAGDPVADPLRIALRHYEIVGNFSMARSYRKVLGKVLAARTHESDELLGSLRCLRRSGDHSAYRQAISRTRDELSLEVVRDEGIRVAEMHNQSWLLGRNELTALQVAAQTLSRSEAGDALAVVLSATRGTAPFGVGHWQAHFSRLDDVLRAAAALAVVARQQANVISAILDLLPEFARDSTMDETFARTVNALDIERAEDFPGLDPVETLASVDAEAWPRLHETLASVFGSVSVPAITAEDLGRRKPTLADAAAALNVVIRDPDAGLAQQLLDKLVATVRNEMSRTREDAHRGSYSFGGFNEADIAAGLILYCGAPLATELVAFLSDTSLPQSFKAPALERIAREPDRATVTGLQELRTAYPQILDASKLSVIRPGVFGESDVDPFPSALRAGGAMGFLSETELLRSVSSLLGRGVRARLEAARVLTSLARRGTVDDWVVALNLQLSYDENAVVRAEAGRAAALASQASVLAGDVLLVRVYELLDEPGLLVPLLVLRGLSEENDVPPEVRFKVQDLAQSHAALGVRLQAGALISGARHENLTTQ